MKVCDICFKEKDCSEHASQDPKDGIIQADICNDCLTDIPLFKIENNKMTVWNRRTKEIIEIRDTD